MSTPAQRPKKIERWVRSWDFPQTNHQIASYITPSKKSNSSTYHCLPCSFYLSPIALVLHIKHTMTSGPWHLLSPPHTYPSLPTNSAHFLISFRSLAKINSSGKILCFIYSNTLQSLKSSHPSSFYMLLKQHPPYLFAHFSQLECKLHGAEPLCFLFTATFLEPTACVLYVVGYGMNGLDT